MRSHERSNRSARKLLLRSVELEPTLERRYHAARAAWRMSDLPAVSIEMERGARRCARGRRHHGRGEGADRARRGRAPARRRLAEGDRARRRRARGARPTNGPLRRARGARPDRVVGRRLRDAGADGRGGARHRPAPGAQGPRGAGAERAVAAPTGSRPARRGGGADRRGLEFAEESGSIVAQAQALHSLGTLHLERRERSSREQQPRGGALALRRGRRRVDARAHAELARVGGRAARRRRRRRSASCARRSGC